MTINEQGLRRRIGSDNLIGCYTIAENGQSCFTDIRGGEGDIVKNPVSDTIDLVVEYSDTKLIQGDFYSFHWKLSDDKTAIVVDGQPERIDNAKFLQGLFDARLKLSGSNLELFNNFQKTIFNEVTGAQHTYVYELLQNANDYPHNSEKVEVKFILTDHYLFFLHSGACFNLRNVVAISSINQGEKKKNTDTIGYKGIGFKTVFVNNDYVYLRSGEWSLRFDKSYSEHEFAGDCPWALMPIPTHEQDVDGEVMDIMSRYGMRVMFALRHKTDASKNIEQLDKVFSDNQILLFIPNVYKVDVISNGDIRHSVEKDDKKWVVTDYRYSVPDDLKIWVEENINSGDKIPEKFKDISNVRISFAVGREGNTLVPVENARVYNYLPTELRLGFKFLFNADFVPNGSRSGLHDVVWNDRIMEQCGSQFADWWVSFLEKEGEYDMASVFELLPEFNNRDKYALMFLKGFKARISQIPCIPTLRDGYHLVKLEDVLYDKIDFIACKEPVLSDEELYEFSDTTGSLPHPAIRTNNKLKELLSHFNLSIEFNNNQLTQLCFEDDFKEWLRVKDNNLSFISYLLKYDYIMNFWGYKIFLKEDGALDKADSIYYDIDQFYDDISFLTTDLPRLNIEIRDTLSRDYRTWAGYSTRFKRFNEYEFTRKIFGDFSRYSQLFSIQQNSVNYLHFLAVNNSIHQIPSDYPYYDHEGNIVTGVTDLYQVNETGKDLANRTWIKKEWIKFLHEDYLSRDEEKVIKYLESTCKIKSLSYTDCYKLFISKEDRVPEIAELIKDKESNIDFYRYLSKIQDSISNLSQQMRQSYQVLTTDGKEEQWHPISRTIFWKDSDWETMSNNPWMPEGCCLAISEDYFNGIAGTESSNLSEFFSQKQIVQKYSVAGLYQSLRSHLKEVFSKITTKEISKDFLNWLFLNRSQIFKNGIIDPQYRSIPVKVKDSDVLLTIESLGGSIYLPNREALELYSQPWFNSTDLTICDEFYSNLFDGSERCQFFVTLGMKQFEKLHYLRAHLFKHLDRVKPNLNERDNNISFHRYLADIHDGISEKDFEVIKDMPIFISSPEVAEGELVDSSNNHYLPSALLTDIISKDLFPTSILDSIHPDYILSDKDKKYFIDKLGNVEIDEDGFYEYIIKEHTSSEVKNYLQDKERNIRFWRWVADSKNSREKKAKLAIFPMLGKAVGEESEHLVSPSSLYISGKYTNVEGLEQFIHEHISKPVFVSEEYIEDGIERDWNSLFRALKLTVDFKEIVFNDVLPKLSNYKDKPIVGILARYSESFKAKLESDDAKTSTYLNNLQLLCNDGVYRTPKDVVVSGQYFDVEQNMFPDIEIGNLLSEEYLSDCGTDAEKRREITKFIVLIADYLGKKCESATQLRDLKLKHFVQHQDYYAQTEAHYRIIADLAKAFNTDSVGILEIIRDLGTIKLFTTTGKLINSFGQYLSTIYIPDCQYMANGITELDFVSEKYDDYCPNGLKRFFSSCLGIIDGFNEYNLRLLQNERFALYFWTQYAQSRDWYLKDILTDDKLRGLACIPTTQGMKKPMEVYDYRNPNLQKIVLKLKDGTDKLPAIELPGWIEKIGLRNKLYILDCLEYLSLDTHDFRREVIKWFVDTNEETLQRFQSDIARYRTTANWFNGSKNWVPLNTLVALEWGNETLKGNFGGNAFVCNPSYMPEAKEDFNKLCKILKIKVLTNNDFRKQKAGKCQTDIEAIREISKRLVYLAYKTGKENWEEIYAGYKDKLDRADISKCESIIYSYNENIVTDLEIYSEEASNLWYVDSWQGSMFIEILDWIIKKLEVKGTFDQNFLRKLFLRPFVDFIKQQEGGSLPNELLIYLDEADRAVITVDENVNAEVFTDDASEVNSLPDHLKQQAGQGLAQRQTQQAQASNQSEEEESDNTGSGADDDEQPQSERKRRSDLGGTHQRHETSSSENRFGNNLPEQHSSGDKGKAEEPEEQRKPLADRLHEKWEKQKQAPVQKPHSARPAADGDVFSQPSSSSENNKGEFFDDAVNTRPYTQERNNTTEQQNQASTTDRRNREALSSKQKAAQEELDKAKDQADLNEAIDRTEKYTFLWFKYLMEQLYNQKNNTAATRSVQIDFREAKVLDDYTIAIVKPNRVVPKWIEHADDITLHILKGNVSEKIEVNLQYFTEDAIWAYYENASDLETKINEADKVRLIANGSYANHIDSLTKQFIRLDFPDDYNLRDNLPDCIKYIYGPPGTGKTTRLVSRIEEIVTSNDSPLDILVLTPTNKAADVIASRLDALESCSQYTYRYGVTESLDYLKSNNVYTRDDEFIESDDHHVVVTTAARYAYDYLMPSEEIICDHHWDYVIIDEASMMDIVTMAFILHKSKDCQFIISGDPKQIQPVRQNEIQPENIYQMVGLNSFAAAQNDPKVECLNIQYRSIPTIGSLVSEFSYNGLVKPNRTQQSQRLLDLGFKISSINFVGFKTELLDNLYGLDAIDDSAFHLYSAIFGYEYASFIAKKVSDMNPEEPYSIGIVCPYKKQADCIKQMIELRDISNDYCKVNSGTVHSFQGDECDIMIVVLNPPMNVGQNAHVNNQNIINVAMSRAKDYVFFLVPDNRTPGFTTREVLGKMASDKSIMFCNDIEKIMFGQDDYIQQHTNVTCHMPVNVYYEPSSLYEVRKDDMAVDIQINEQFR